MRFNAEDDLKNCGNCSLSLFDSREAAISFWFSDSKFMEKIRGRLQYTHILKGELKKELGVATKERPHLELFEYAGVELRNHFEILEPLIKP